MTVEETAISPTSGQFTELEKPSVCAGPRRDLRMLLVIDDDYGFRLWVRTLVGTRGYGVIERDRGSHVHAALCEACSLVILDLVMPDEEGIETMGRLRCEGVTTKILAVSGADDGDLYLGLARHLGADAVASKQTAPRELLQTIELLARQPAS